MPAPAGTHSWTEPAFAWIDPVTDRLGRVTPSEPALRRRSTVEIAATEPSPNDADPAFTCALTSPSVAPARSSVPRPALTWTSSPSVTAAGNVSRHVSRSPKASQAVPGSWRDRTSSVDSSDRTVGPEPSLSLPSRCQFGPCAAPTVISPQSRASVTSPVDPNAPSRAGNGVAVAFEPHDPAENPETPTLKRPPTMMPIVAATIRPPMSRAPPPLTPSAPPTRGPRRRSKRVGDSTGPPRRQRSIRGQSLKSGRRSSAELYPPRTASGIAPTRMRKIPQPRNPRRICMAEPYWSGEQPQTAECPLIV